MPALIAAVLCARIAELAAATPAPREIVLGFALDGLALARGLPLLFVLTVPALMAGAARARAAAVGGVWSVLVLAHGVLAEYGLTTRVPLGADLLGYSWAEVTHTFAAGAAIDVLALVRLALPLACLWAALFALAGRPWQPAPRAAVAVLAASVVLAAAPGQGRMADLAHASPMVANKAAYFVEDIVGWWLRPRPSVVATEPVARDPVVTQPVVRAAVSTPPVARAGAPPDPRYPFLREERTPDVLGTLLRQAPAPPNLVFVIVEGLGRSFSGPGAAHGSFTPFLDELAERSLYFENFLANQGRTFAALPTIFGSLPFGDKGFAAHADVKPLPPHLTLLSILGGQGYHVRFYAGFDLAFDKERPFLEQQNVASIVDSHSFGPGYGRANSWGYGDAELAARTLAGEAGNLPRPSVVVVQTVTLHTPYTFPEQATYADRLEQRLDALAVPAAARAHYREFSKVYTAILYADDALRTLVEGLARGPAWSNTILVLTGDHSIPELPLATRIERFHVPLIIHSPLLKAPARIKAVSSQMDLAPSLLAYLARGHGLRTPARVTWLGTGLDLEPRFRNVHEVPLKLGKHIAADIVVGPWYLSRGQLFRLGDGMTETPATDAQALAQAAAALARFSAGNDRFIETGALMPESAVREWVAFSEERRAPAEAAAAAAAAIEVESVRVPPAAPRDALVIEAVFRNASGAPAPAFVPLVVLMAADGRELGETYGKALTLAPQQSITVSLAVAAEKGAAGRHFLAVIPSDPVTGKAVGTGRYRVPVELR